MQFKQTTTMATISVAACTDMQLLLRSCKRAQCPSHSYPLKTQIGSTKAIPVLPTDVTQPTSQHKPRHHTASEHDLSSTRLPILHVRTFP
eukprot:1695234-Amphidinium_carterae.1